MERGSQEPEELDFGEKPISSYLQSNLSTKSAVHASRSQPKNSNSGPGKIRMHSKSTSEPRKEGSRKEVPLSNFQSPLKKQQNGFNKSHSRASGLSLNGLHGGSPNLSDFSDNLCKPVDEDCSDSSEKNYNHDLHLGDSKKLLRLDNHIFIPKRPRGTLKRKKHEGLISSKTLITDTTGSCKSTENPATKKLTTDADHLSRLSNGVKKKNFKEPGEKGLTRGSSLPSVKDKNGEKNESSMKASGSKVHKKRTKSSLEEINTLLEDGRHSILDNQNNYGNPVDDDEENLEQNAARMLSSRFVPKYTAFSGSRTASSSRSAKRPLSSRSSCSKLNGFQSEIIPVDAAGRVLHLRRRNRKGFARKRRHFYEVCSQGLDPFSLLRQRIRVFWPLDKSWYFGLVKDYDSETRMHYIKYDDREEEWIDLQKERIKLLLFPSEITDARHSEKHELESNSKRRKCDQNASDGSSVGSLKDSEPIISWLARSNHDLKSFSANILRKRERNGMINDKHSICEMSKFSSRLVAPTALNDRHRIHFVYTRRRFRDKREVHVEDSAKEPNLTIYSKEWRQMTLQLVIPLEHFKKSSIVTGCFWLFHSVFLLQYGVIRPLWPLVHMEVVLTDNVMGLRFLSFEGSLRWAVILMCLIGTTLCQQEEGIKLMGNQIPSTSIAFKLSSLHDQGRELLFMLCSFLQLKQSRWRYLEDRLKRYCSEIRELPVVKFLGTNINTFQCGCSQILCTSNTSNSSSLEGFSGGSIADTGNQITAEEPFNTKLKTTSPFFLSCYLKLLLQKNTAIYGYPSALSEHYRHPMLASGSCFLNDKSSDLTSAIKAGSHKLGTLLSNAPASSGMTSGEPKLEHHSGSVCDDVCISSSDAIVNSVNKNSIGIIHMGNFEDNENAYQLENLSCHSEPDRGANRLHATSSDKSSPVKSSPLGVKDVQVREFNEVKERPDLDVMCSLHMSGETNELILHSPRKTAPRSTWCKNQHRSDSTNSGQGLTNREDFLRNGCSLSSRKPRTRVFYSFPCGDDEPGLKPQNDYQKVRPHNKIGTDSIRRMSFNSRRRVSYLESLTCDANVLVTAADRGWRDCGAQIILESDDHQEWRISVKISGDVRYVYKAHHLLQPGTTNRYTHAMMWKGGKDWTLEFIDRRQWSLFKEIHEECYNRNIRAAYAKNIPTPGVWLVDDAYEHVVDVPFFRSSSKYIRQNGNEVDMALNPSRVLYDMDSSDEEWLADFRCSMDDKEDNDFEITDYLFEKVIDMFEKLSYTHAGDEFTSDDIEEYMAEIGPMDIIKAIYDYWRDKRQKKGIPLIRQFQPALWELYQHQLKEWESALCKLQNGTGSLPQKPPMFAFCLRPRGLELPNKGSNQRSHKKFIFSGYHNVFVREQESFHGCGRKSNGYTGGEEKGLAVGIPPFESSDSFNWRHCSSSFSPGFSPRDTAMAGTSTMSSDGSEGSQYTGFSRSKTKKTGIFLSPREFAVMPFSRNMKTRGNGFQNFDLCERQTRWPSQSDEFQRSRVDIDEFRAFRLHDAANVARHASKIAKFKKEKAQWFLHKADLAIHKANAALIIAEAIKASEKEPNIDEDPNTDEELTSD